MAVFEEVVSGLNRCIESDPDVCRSCPYFMKCSNLYNPVELKRDALEMLESQAIIINRLQKDVADLRDALSMTD